VNLLGGVGFIEYIDAHALPNSRPQYRPRELTVVGSGDYLSTIPGVTGRQLNFAFPDAQRIGARLPGKREGTEGEDARQLQKRPASEQAG